MGKKIRDVEKAGLEDQTEWGSEQNYNPASCCTRLWNLVAHTEGEMRAEGFQA